MCDDERLRDAEEIVFGRRWRKQKLGLAAKENGEVRN
jgi:hypothetical protein